MRLKLVPTWVMFAIVFLSFLGSVFLFEVDVVNLPDSQVLFLSGMIVGLLIATYNFFAEIQRMPSESEILKAAHQILCARNRFHRYNFTDLEWQIEEPYSLKVGDCILDVTIFGDDDIVITGNKDTSKIVERIEAQLLLLGITSRNLYAQA